MENKVNWIFSVIGILVASLAIMGVTAQDGVYEYEESEIETLEVARIEELTHYIPEKVTISIPASISTNDIVREAKPEHVVFDETLFETTEVGVESEETYISLEETSTEVEPFYFIEYDGRCLTEASVRSLANYIAPMYGLDPDILLALSWIESRWTPDAVSVHNAVGLCQIIPKWHYGRMAKLGVTSLYDPYSNMLTSADLLHELQSYPNGADIQWVLMAYNLGVDDANVLYNQGIVTDYARDVLSKKEEL